MSMQITVNPNGLTKEQREAVAGFILAWPAGKVAQAMTALTVDIDVDTTKAVAKLDELQTQIAEADLAFGSAAAPLAPAPSIAVAAPLQTAQEATGATSSTASASVHEIPAPPPANTAATVAPPAPPTQTHAPGVELDSAGLPWDARIHSESKSKIADGTWRQKRGVDKTLLADVEAELKRVMAIPAAHDSFAPPPPPAAPVSEAGPAVTLGEMSIADASRRVSAGPLTNAVVGDISPLQKFTGLIGRASAAIQAGKITAAEVIGICNKFELPGLPMLGNRLDLVDSVAMEIDGLIVTRG